MLAEVLTEQTIFNDLYLRLKKLPNVKQVFFDPEGDIAIQIRTYTHQILDSERLGIFKWLMEEDIDLLMSHIDDGVENRLTRIENEKVPVQEGEELPKPINPKSLSTKLEIDPYTTIGAFRFSLGRVELRELCGEEKAVYVIDCNEIGRMLDEIDRDQYMNLLTEKIGMVGISFNSLEEIYKREMMKKEQREETSQKRLEPVQP